MTVLLDKRHAHAPRHEREKTFRLQGGDARDLGREIQLVQLSVDFIDDLTLVIALEPGNHVFARLIIRRDDCDLLRALLREVFAHGFGHCVVLPGNVEEEGIAALPRKNRWSGVCADQEGLRIGDRFENSGEDVGKYDSRHKVHFVAFDQRLGPGDGHIGLELVIHGDQADVAAAQLVSMLLEVKVKAVLHMFADRGSRTRQGCHETNFERFRRSRKARRKQKA